MKSVITAVVGMFFAMFTALPALGADPVQMERQRIEVKPRVPVTISKTAAFRVTQVKFDKGVLNNQTRLTAAVIFNKTINPGTVQQNVNIRLLKRNANGFWVDASTHGNIVNVRPNFITWVSGAPIETGALYKMHLRGTIKSMDGQYLDCNGDGKGEGGALPPYESQTYQAPGTVLLEIPGSN